MFSGTPKKYRLTLFLLCLGYFIDFYDLTIMGVSYSELIQEQFYITDRTTIQQTYLLISNFQTVGIFIGAILFGILGDKIGRARAIQYSILLYSLSTIFAVYTHSLYLFIFLRVIAYMGLSSEFSTSTVLILELFPRKLAAWGTAILYSFGVLGGILATTIGIFSWKVMFLFGGIFGLLLYIGRTQLRESEAYLYARHHSQQTFGSIYALITHKEYLLKLFRYFLMILPFFALITMIFIFPNYIIEKNTLAYAMKLLLLGFFCGNIISCLFSAIYIHYFQQSRYFLFCTLFLFVILMSFFSYIPESYLFIYSIGLGLIGGGYPILLIQEAAREYPIHLRSLATNSIFAMGRASGIFFNILMSIWLTSPQIFIPNAVITAIIVFILAFLAVAWHTK